jgi:predicted nuclease of predicted toxin-antitoxin system
VSGLLFDQILPARLCTSLSDVLGELTHVRHAGLSEASDADVFDYARRHNLTIVTKDSDFQSLLALHGSPPRVIWMRIGNATIDTLESALRHNAVTITEFHSTDAACSIIR